MNYGRCLFYNAKTYDGRPKGGRGTAAGTYDVFLGSDNPSTNVHQQLPHSCRQKYGNCIYFWLIIIIIIFIRTIQSVMSVFCGSIVNVLLTYHW